MHFQISALKRPVIVNNPYVIYCSSEWSVLHPLQFRVSRCSETTNLSDLIFVTYLCVKYELRLLQQFVFGIFSGKCRFMFNDLNRPLNVAVQICFSVFLTCSSVELDFSDASGLRRTCITWISYNSN